MVPAALGSRARIPRAIWECQGDAESAARGRQAAIWGSTHRGGGSFASCCCPSTRACRPWPSAAGLVLTTTPAHTCLQNGQVIIAIDPAATGAGKGLQQLPACVRELAVHSCFRFRVPGRLHGASGVAGCAHQRGYGLPESCPWSRAAMVASDGLRLAHLTKPFRLPVCAPDQSAGADLRLPSERRFRNRAATAARGGLVDVPRELFDQLLK